MATKEIIVLFALIGLIVGGFLGSFAFANEVVKEVEVEKIVTQNVTVEVPTEVLVDNENLGLVLKTIYDNDGDVEYLLNDLDSTEVSKIVDRIKFTNNLKLEAVSVIQNELFEEIDKVNVSGNILDEDELERLKIDDRDYEISVSVDDFEDGEAEVTVTGTFEQEGVLFEFEAVLKFDNNKFDEFDSINVTLA